MCDIWLQLPSYLWDFIRVKSWLKEAGRAKPDSKRPWIQRSPGSADIRDRRSEERGSTVSASVMVEG